MFVANNRQLLVLLERGTHITEISRLAHWPARQVQAFAARQGYLFGSDGHPYRPVFARSGSRRRVTSS